MADSVELGGVEAEEVVLGETAGAEQAGEDVRQDGIAVVEVAVDLAAARASGVISALTASVSRGEGDVPAATSFRAWRIRAVRPGSGSA